MHKFNGEINGNYSYEITFNKSLEDTVRMNAMCRGLDRFDKMKPFWRFIHNLICHPLLITNAKWAYKFHNWTANRM